MKNFMENLHLTKKQWYYLGAVLGVCLIYLAFTHFKGSEAPKKTIQKIDKNRAFVFLIILI